ncbi:hypothetical protein [Salinisphaera sp. T31B1]|uniref:hypothetical protein n=1 Tax=Salinisphaera sp. T31B1 TaxID=727963 RepID=UPI003341E02F
MSQESLSNPQGLSVRISQPQIMDAASVTASTNMGQRLSLDMNRLFYNGYAQVLNHAADDRDAPTAVDGNSCRVLNQCIADCVDLQSQCRQVRWHLTDSAYLEHRAVCTQAIRRIEQHVNLMGERVVQLNGHVEGTLAQVVERSGLSGYPVMVEEAESLVDAVNGALWLVSQTMREDSAELIRRGDAMSHELLEQAAASLEQCLELLCSRNTLATHP